MTSLVVRGLVKESTGVNGEGWQSVSSHQQTIVSQRLINAVRVHRWPNKFEMKATWTNIFMSFKMLAERELWSHFWANLRSFFEV
jgi:hypothetical protein